MSRPTILDVAARAGVSKSLVSLVMRGAASVSPERRRRVLEASAEIGYRPNAAARSLVQRRTNLIGVLLSDVHDPCLGEVVDGVQGEAALHGFRTIICAQRRSEPSDIGALETLLELRADGLIVVGPGKALDALGDAARELPTVLLGHRARTDRADSVASDDAKGARLAVEHLVSLGHSRIAHIDGGAGAGAGERRAGYERTMKRLGLAEHVRVVAGSFSEEGGRAGVEALLSTGETPSAIVAPSDLAALGALQALSDRGVGVPAEVSIVGYDDTTLAGTRHAALTSVRQPRADLGRMSVAFLLERLTQGRTDPRAMLVAPSLNVRGTTGPAKRTRRRGGRG